MLKFLNNESNKAYFPNRGIWNKGKYINPKEVKKGECGEKTFREQKGQSMEKAMAPHSSTLAWKSPWTEEPGRLQTMGSLRVRHD